MKLFFSSFYKSHIMSIITFVDVSSYLLKIKPALGVALGMVGKHTGRGRVYSSSRVVNPGPSVD
jgi:hypothetical protein